MCGIAGIYHINRPEAVSRDLMEQMNARLVHRGPDEGGVHLQGSIGLAMRRLSIIDLAQGQQPMSNEDGTLWIVFNGEIYNFQQLRDQLIMKGHLFKTSSDTEVILHLYEEMGENCVSELRGMFAFAIWDEKNEKLFLARDRFGKKPLVYSMSDGRFSWASELQALKVLPWISNEIDMESVDLYLGLQYIPSPNTIYKSIRKLPPAHTLTIEKGQMHIRRYWNLAQQSQSLSLSIEEAKSKILGELKEATRIRMISEVPLGAFLSGGLDSTCIVGLMSQMSDRPIKTFSIGFEEEQHSELPYAREAAKFYGTDHTEFVVKPNMIDVLPKMAMHYGEPFGDTSAFATYFLARETRRHVTVALNGDGGDENFAGYRRYIPMKWDLMPSGKHYLRVIGIFQGTQKNKLYSAEFKRALDKDFSEEYLNGILRESKGMDRVNRWLYMDFRSYLPECLMTKVDIATMANSLEGRSPLLDHKFVESVFQLKGNWKLKGLFQTKWIFREAIRKIVPPSILSRKKMGFGIPVHDWFRKDLRSFFKDAVCAHDSFSRRFFNQNHLMQLIDEHGSLQKNHGYRFWNLLMLECWYRGQA